MGAAIAPMTGPVDDKGNIDYDLALPLDAEDLAEEGIHDAYREIARDHGIGTRPAPGPATGSMIGCT